MTKSQAKKLYGIEGTKKARRQWSVAKRRGRVPNNHDRVPNIKEIKK